MKLKKLMLVLALVVALTAFAGAMALAQGPPTTQQGNAMVDICNLNGGHAVFCP